MPATENGAHSPSEVAKVPSFLAINPQLFESVEHWSYRDLQKLARRLELSANGQRQELIERLREWHRDQRKTGQAGAFHSVEVRASVEGKPISPRLLSPLVVNRSQNGIMSPGRSPLKATTPRSNVLFSPYNMVKLIPAKEHSEMFGQYREPTYDDWMVDDNN